jgi:hypothetical protein
MKVFTKLLSTNNQLQICISELTKCKFFIRKVFQLKPQPFMIGRISLLVSKSLHERQQSGQRKPVKRYGVPRPQLLAPLLSHSRPHKSSKLIMLPSATLSFYIQYLNQQQLVCLYLNLEDNLLLDDLTFFFFCEYATSMITPGYFASAW